MKTTVPTKYNDLKYEYPCIEEEKETFQDFEIGLLDGSFLQVDMAIYSKIEKNIYYDEDGAPDEMIIEDVEFITTTLWSAEGEQLNYEAFIKDVLNQVAHEIKS